jgi:hypothetical protein
VWYEKANMATERNLYNKSNENQFAMKLFANSKEKSNLNGFQGLKAVLPNISSYYSGCCLPESDTMWSFCCLLLHGRREQVPPKRY